MSENNLLEQDNNLNEITAENGAAAVEAEIEAEMVAAEAAVENDEKRDTAEAVIFAEAPPAINKAPENSAVGADPISAEAEAAAEVYDEINEIATEAEEGNFPPVRPRKRFNRLWIPVVFLSAAVVALSIMTGTLWKLLRDNSTVEEAETSAPEQTVPADDNNEIISISSKDDEPADIEEYIEIKENGKLTYWDGDVGYAWTPVLDGVKLNDYRRGDFVVDADGRISYMPDGDNMSFFGIDVSYHQGDIDWQLVREDDVEFAFLRIGYRGYGEEGNIKPDEKFEDNYNGATDAGIGVGVYFFSQAITVEEAVEEAKYVLGILNGRTLDYPVVFDWETITEIPDGETARTEDVTAQTLTLAAIAFCDTISDAGYKPMIYTGKKQSILKYDLRKLNNYPKWFAHYNTEFDYCYDFDFWQYGYGKVDGIEGDVDLNVAILK